jgi:uncharacterized protein with NAD-binding domain and iron-sulfur cluster
MAGLAAAHRLTRPDGPGHEVTVYQRGHRLGGKAASSRGVHGRIEEHGLHIWLGYYDNAFGLVRRCYEELDREATAPGCSIRTWRDAFAPVTTVGLGETDDRGWHDWLAMFPDSAGAPGEPDARTGAISVPRLVEQVVALLTSLGESLGRDEARPRAVLSTQPTPPRRPRVRSVAGLAGALAALDVALRNLTPDSIASRRAAQFADLLLAMLRGVLADQLLIRGYNAVDHLDLREWLAVHGASPSTLESPFVTGMYDLVFGYEEGDHARPAFSAGLGLRLSAHTFFDYKGALFWRMRAGMGDAVIAPIYEVLRQRGVRFEFFHRLDALHVDDATGGIGRISLGRQVDLASGVDEYDPLAIIGGLPVFPAEPDHAQLDPSCAGATHDLESHGTGWPDAAPVELFAERDYDAVVLATSIGMVPHVCGELLERDARWQAMVANVRTVATQALQLWLRPDEAELGWSSAGAVITGCGAPFDTFASMSHLLAHETWPSDDEPRTLGYFCAVLPEAEGAGHGATDVVAANARRFLDERAAAFWPHSVDDDGRFRHDLLVDDGFFVRANTDPSDRYVLSLPGSARHRLRADRSGFANLAIAGDWIDSGLNAGCIEAAVLSGLQAANAVEGLPLTTGTTGFAPQDLGSFGD